MQVRGKIGLPVARGLGAALVAGALALWLGCGGGGGSGAGGGSSDAGPPPASSAPQLGLNFIRFYWSGSGYEPSTLFSLLADIGPDAIRQLHRGDPRWSIVEPSPGQWDFTEPDSVLLASPYEPILRLFGLYWQSPTPPWSSVLVPDMNPDCESYVRTVVRRYRDVVRYWELGNEMERWSWFDPGGSVPSYASPPPFDASAGFSTAQQGAFLAAVAAIVREEDPDAVILLPGLSGPDGWSRDWLRGVTDAAGSDWFDIVNYHDYGPWNDLLARHTDFVAWLGSVGLGAKPIWLTETGCSSDPSLSLRTDYPNSPEQQAADVFRRPLLAWGAGVPYVGWHTWIGGTNGSDPWRFYGLRLDDAARTPQPSLYSMQLLISELLPFERVVRETADSSPLHRYRIERRDGSVRWVVWGSGTDTVPAGASAMTGVHSADGSFSWTAVSPDSPITATDVPVLLR